MDKLMRAIFALAVSFITISIGAAFLLFLYVMLS